MQLFAARPSFKFQPPWARFMNSNNSNNDNYDIMIVVIIIIGWGVVVF